MRDQVTVTMTADEFEALRALLTVLEVARRDHRRTLGRLNEVVAAHRAFLAAGDDPKRLAFLTKERVAA